MRKTPENIKADWSRFERRPTWSVVSSRELAVALSVPHQHIANWRLRGILPEPEPPSRFLNGRKNYYRISKIQAWLEGKPEEAIHWEWIQRWMPEQLPRIHHLAHAERWLMRMHKQLGLEKPLVPESLSCEEWNPFYSPWIDSRMTQGVNEIPAPRHHSGDTECHPASL